MTSEEIRKYAVFVLGHKQETETWLNSQARGLDYRLPIEVMRDDQGRQEVHDVLCRIDYGVYI